MLAFVFPGQGSQQRGMGGALFDKVPEFADLEAEIDAILGFSVRDLCLNGDGQRLRDTQYTQPCLYVVNALSFLDARANGLEAQYLAGHSLGEYNALHAAGAFDFLTGLRLVQFRAQVMSRVRDGGMAAVVGLMPEVIERIIDERSFASLDIANYNTPLQTVISGSLAEIEAARRPLEEAGATGYVPLPVSGAFHSRQMATARMEFRRFICSLNFGKPLTPVISNVTGMLYPTERHDEIIKALLASQISEPVRWSQSIEALLKLGVHEFTELGPGQVLTRLIQQIKQHHEGMTRAAGC